MTEINPHGEGHPFPRLVARLKKAGVAPEKVDRYALLIGDTPELGDGVVIVRDEAGTVLDRVPAWVIG